MITKTVREHDMTEPTRALILNAAADGFAFHGYYGTSVQDIADRVGIQKASLFYYFPSKKILYLEVSNRFIAMLHAVVLPSLNEDGQRCDKIESLAGRLFDLFAGNPNCARMLYRELLDGEDRIAEVSNEWFAPLFTAAVGFYEAGRTAGEFKAMDPMHFIISTLGTITFYFVAAPVFESHFGREFTSVGLLAERRRQVIDHTLRAIITGH